LYTDWLVWAGNTAFHCLESLDKFERYFRKAALAYHQIPYQTRHSSTLLSGAKANPVTLKILSQIFESNEPRSRLKFFAPFYTVKDAALNVLVELNRLEAVPVDFDELRNSERKCEKNLEPLSYLLFELLKNLRWLRGIVDEIQDRSGTKGSDALAQKHSREGGLFRLWISSLPELEFGSNVKQSTYVDWYAESLLEYGDNYRNAGRAYHWTRMAARQPGVFPTIPIDDLKSHFTLSHTSEYDNIFKPFHDDMAALVDLRATHLRYFGTVEELAHRLHVHLNPRLRELGFKAKSFRSAMARRRANAHDFASRSAQLFDHEPNGVQWSWHHPAGGRGTFQYVPLEQKEEWELFLEWISVLPETQPAIDAGRTLKEVACDTLYLAPDGFESDYEKGTEDNENGGDDDGSGEEWYVEDAPGDWIALPLAALPE
ncbi:hypothetical protein DE146DRAFT_774917, partial [Phaeosphaeria sp. MPI-PUGE-AT-0046c]